MKALQLFAIIFFTSALMGCQIEVAPLESDQIGPSANSNTNSQNTTEVDSSDSEESDATAPEASPEPSSVTLYWSAPLERVNGEVMESAEIGGYEIRYKRETDSSYTNVVIADASIDQHSIEDLVDVDSYSFEVAVFDTDGIYSDFVVAMAN
jgi:hypothetical protein